MNYDPTYTVHIFKGDSIEELSEVSNLDVKPGGVLIVAFKNGSAVGYTTEKYDSFTMEPSKGE